MPALRHERFVLLRRQELVELAGIRGLQEDHPPFAVGVLVDGLGLLRQLGVDLEHLAGDRREEIRDGLDRLDDAERLMRDDLRADLRQLDEDHVAQLLLREVRDPHADAVTLPLGPLVLARVLEVCGDVSHQLVLCICRRSPCAGLRGSTVGAAARSVWLLCRRSPCAGLRGSTVGAASRSVWLLCRRSPCAGLRGSTVGAASRSVWLLCRRSPCAGLRGSTVGAASRSVWLLCRRSPCAGLRGSTVGAASRSVWLLCRRSPCAGLRGSTVGAASRSVWLLCRRSPCAGLRGSTVGAALRDSFFHTRGMKRR